MKYLLLTIAHKWFVLLAGLRVGVPLWRLLIHDWSKFTPAELPHYQRQFFGDKGDPDGFERAWKHHVEHNPHHWEHWVTHPPGHPVNLPGIPQEMPPWAAREMVADWLAACRTYDKKWPTKGEWDWLHKNWRRINLHPVTRGFVLRLLVELGLADLDTLP